METTERTIVIDSLWKDEKGATVIYSTDTETCDRDFTFANISEYVDFEAKYGDWETSRTAREALCELLRNADSKFDAPKPKPAKKAKKSAKMKIPKMTEEECLAIMREAEAEATVEPVKKAKTLGFNDKLCPDGSLTVKQIVSAFPDRVVVVKPAPVAEVPKPAKKEKAHNSKVSATPQMFKPDCSFDIINDNLVALIPVNSSDKTCNKSLMISIDLCGNIIQVLTTPKATVKEYEQIMASVATNKEMLVNRSQSDFAKLQSAMSAINDTYNTYTNCAIVA